MKLIRFGNKDNELPGIIDSDGVSYDVSGFGSDYDQKFFEDDGLSALNDWFSSNKTNCAQIAESVRMAAPLARPGKLVCIGLNYSDHAKESGMKLAEVGTGGDPSHAPARRSYEKAGYTALPLVRYYKDL